MKSFLFLLLIATVLPALPCSAPAQELRVGVVEYPPFGITDRGEPQGICPEIWRKTADEIGLTYQTVTYASISRALEAVAGGELDVAIGPITVTSDRLRRMAFTQPFFRAEVGLLLPAEPPSLWTRVKPFFRLAVLTSCAVLLLILFLVGNLLWLAERRRNSSQFPETYLRGIGNGMWFALVTLTTVGYGDRVPVTPAGRVISGVWMVVAMLTISSLTAGLASAFTIALSDTHAETLSGPTDLSGRRVAAVTGTTSARRAAEYGARLVETSSLEEAVDQLAQNRVEAVAFGRPLLKYYLRQRPNPPYRTSAFSLAVENYAFAVTPGAPWLDRFNISLLSLQESGAIAEITQNWLDGE